MRVENLRLQGIGGFTRERTFAFPAEWTLVTGGNESGKTALVSALHGALFGLPEGSVPLCPRGPAWAELTFAVGTRTFTIRRDFRAGRVRFVETTSGSDVPLVADGEDLPEDSPLLGDALESVLGLADGLPWTRAGLVLQGALETQLDERVRAWMSGTRRGDYETVLGRLVAERDRLAAAGGAAAVSELEDLREEIRQRRLEAEGWEERAAGLWDLGERLQAAERERETSRHEEADLDDMIQSLMRFEDLARDRIRLEENLQQLRGEQARIRKQVETMEAGDAQLEKEFADFLDAPGDIEECLHDWTEGVNRRRDLERDLERAREAIQGLPEIRTKRNGSIAAAALGVVAWFACLGAGAATLGTILLPLFAAVGYGAVWYLDRSAQRMRLSREQELVWLDAEREKVLIREREARKGLGKLTRFSEPSQLRKEYRRYIDAHGGLERARGAIESHRPLREVMENYDATFSDLQLLDTQTRDLVAQARFLSGLDADLPALVARRENSQQRLDKTRRRAEELEEETSRLRADVARLEAEIPAPGRLVEDLDRLERRERELWMGAAALDAAVDALQEAARSSQEGHLDRVAARAGAIFESISRGRYGRVRFTEAVVPEVQSTDGDWVAAEGLSGSALAQLHLALRLAANEEVAGDRGLPVVLDEAFPAWDEERLGAAGQVLAELAEGGRQIIVLSADPRLAEWGHETLALSGSSDGETGSGLQAA